MASNASVPSRGLPPKPPDKGSFPLDHYGECSDAKRTYVQCLREHAMQAQSEDCRSLSAAYLKCRMDRDLMAKEELDRLGFSGRGGVKGTGGIGGAGDAAAAPGARDGASADATESKERRSSGFLAGLPTSR